MVEKSIWSSRRVEARIKGKVYREVMRPALLFELETETLTKKREAELEVAELKEMLRFSLGLTGMESIQNKHTRGTARVGYLEEKEREAGLN